MTAAVLTAARPARADSTLVVLVRPQVTGNGASELVNRVRGELLADGFSVLLADPVPEADRAASLGRIGHASGAPVVAGLFVEDEGNSIQLCIVDELNGHVLARPIDDSKLPNKAAAPILARRAVELLRASLLDFLVASLRSAVSGANVSPPPPLPPAPPSAPQRDESRWAIEAGLGVLGSFDRLGAATVPVARIHYALNPTFHLRLTAAWLGTQPRVERPAGSVSVEQGIALVEATAQPWHEHWIRPMFSVGTGVYYVGTNGSGEGVYEGVRASQLALAVDAGTGVVVRIGAHLEFGLEVHAIVSQTGITISIVDEVATVGRPSMLGTITLAGWI